MYIRENTIIQNMQEAESCRQTILGEWIARPDVASQFADMHNQGTPSGHPEFVLSPNILAFGPSPQLKRFAERVVRDMAADYNMRTQKDGGMPAATIGCHPITGDKPEPGVGQVLYGYGVVVGTPTGTPPKQTEQVISTLIEDANKRFEDYGFSYRLPEYNPSALESIQPANS